MYWGLKSKNAHCEEMYDYIFLSVWPKKESRQRTIESSPLNLLSRDAFLIVSKKKQFLSWDFFGGPKN